jgi:hypothetical protein
MQVILAGILGGFVAVAVAYVIYLRGRVSQVSQEAESLRAMIRLFSERTIVATLSEGQFREILAQISQVVFAALNADPENLN